MRLSNFRGKKEVPVGMKRRVIALALAGLMAVSAAGCGSSGGSSSGACHRKSEGI